MLTTSCHCGAVLIEIARRPRKLTQCNCSVCRRYGAIWAYCRRSAMRLRCTRGALSRYTRRGGTLQFYHCRTCGCVTHYERSTKRADGSDRVGINIRNIDDPAAVALLPIRMFDGAATWRVLEERVQPQLFQSPSGD
jgi:hypothetical protein